MKYLLQIIASGIYTCIYTGIMYLLITISLGYVFTLPWWGILLAILFGGFIMELIIAMFTGFGMIPYRWITKDNLIATWIAILLVLFNVGANIYNLWKAAWGNGTWPIIFCIVASVILLHFIISTINGIMVIYNKRMQ